MIVGQIFNSTKKSFSRAPGITMGREKRIPLSISHSHLIEQWDDKRNGELTPSDVFSDSSEKVWWKCTEYKTHIWATAVRNRTKTNERGCIFCWSRKNAKENSLQDLNMQAALMWHPTKNKLSPLDVLPHSKEAVWWRCLNDKTHEWIAEVYKINRAVQQGRKGYGCPECRSFKRWEFSVAESFPDLIREWHKTKNEGLSPGKLSPASNELVWWQCKKNKQHVYQATINNRVYKSSGCPYCANVKVLAGLNSLAVTHGELAEQWHPTLNEDLTPTQVVAGSNSKAWWQCVHQPEHVWAAQISSRAIMGKGCPYCTGRKADKTNSLASKRPDLAIEWHPTMNLHTGLTPDKVTCGSEKRIWWKCKNDPSHSWHAQIYKRTEGRGHCPYCNPRSRPKHFELPVTSDTAAY